MNSNIGALGYEKKYITKNNVPIYHYANNNLHGFNMCLYIKAGMIYESNAINGLPHLWEHAVFLNIDEHLKGRMRQSLDRYGLTFNGCTYREMIVFDISGVSSNFTKATEILISIFKSFVVSRKELDVEKKRVKREIKGIVSTLSDYARKLVWEGTNLEKGSIGNCGEVDKIGVEMLENYHRETLVAENIFFYITGKCSDEDIINLEEQIENCDLIVSGRVRDNTVPVPSKYLNRERITNVKRGYYNRVFLAFDVPINCCSYDELSAIYSILFCGEMGIINNALSGISHERVEVNAIIEAYRNVWNMFFEFDTDDDIAKVIESIIDGLSKMKKDVNMELDSVKQRKTSQAEIMLDDLDDLNWLMAYEGHIMQDGYASLHDYTNKYFKLTSERIAQISKEIFTCDNLVLVIETDKRTFDTKPIDKLLMRM